MDMSQYMDMFMEESREHLQTLNQRLLDLENNPDDHSLLDDIFRSAHTLKGMSATMGFEKVAELTHEMENVLSRLRSGELSVTTHIVDILFKCLDALENMVEAIGSGSVDTGADELVELLRGAGKGEVVVSSPKPQKTEEAPTPAPAIAQGSISQDGEALLKEFQINQYDLTLLQEAERKNYMCYVLRVEVDPGCVMKSARAYMVFRNLEEHGEIIKSVPGTQEIEDEKFDKDFLVMMVSQDQRAKIESAINNISEVKILQVTEIHPAQVCTEKTEESEATAETPVQQEKAPIQEAKTPARAAQAPAKPANGEPHRKAKVNQTVRVDIERLDNLMNLVGELVINKTRLEQISNSNNLADLNETIEHIDRVTTDLQSVVMKVRMVPIEQVFNRFPRMVRDLAKDLGKEINLIVEGKETELDRTVIDEIGDPLVHMIRNSIDHGIETPEERRKAGKPVEAIVRLVAKHEGNNVVIEVEDDGRGIDAGRIRSKIVEKGMMSAKEVEQLDDNAAVNMIFAPGLSTAEKITDVSGRGVGLDAVKTKIESLSGTVEIETKLGVGTKFKIRLPLTLAIIQALLVNVGNEPYAIPLGTIDETTSIHPNHIKNVQNQEVTLLRGNVLPLVRLDNVLDIPPRELEEEELYVVVVRKGEKKAGLIVDSLVGQQEIVIKSLGKLLQGIPGIAGAAILGNGQVSLILDVGTLF